MGAAGGRQVFLGRYTGERSIIPLLVQKQVLACQRRAGTAKHVPGDRKAALLLTMEIIHEMILLARLMSKGERKVTCARLYYIYSRFISNNFVV